ncbi:MULTISPECIES: thioredoxin domain-containing protein [Myxococcus]|uniref:Thymidylate kinase n=1 Tax=Myxococcus xanthus TaxID=34 RepID=A0AAE6G5A3_MYXXA|nr:MULTISPECIES: thioredoxin domain-containing protein [Myxococcus]QDE70829.1 thymidylate kinase [Myxococcus xanthus]QDE78108.1 thymidylate kinase [Myxococcus xanthus]QDF07379.1 thymidylate kinase [Myxococcus xanthus]WAM24981.1 thioredoxin domain-containing protein [Myxococcus sp. NMCA1]
MATPPPSADTSNRLAREPSPYLRQHAHNPVDWFPWGEEALAKAKAENKPILLSVGYSACHWCHVMAHESFESPETARLMNEGFINIKVDREERPDLDQIYQGVVQLMGQGGGWPLTVFLTPDLKPFYGGTYFPPQDRYGRPGFPRLLMALRDAWENKQDEVQRQSAQFEEGLGELATYGLEAAPAVLTAADVVGMGQRMAKQVDAVHGGFGGAPKFPNPMNFALMLRAWRRGGGAPLKDAVFLTLERMALGGIYDQLGGGFHRYSVDERWLVPHFEKMLYDNAQLLHLYAQAQQVEPRPLWRKVVEETVAYVRREMTDVGGGFYAAQDADSEGEEGKFFVWRPEEVRAALPEGQAELVLRHFGIKPGGNFEHGATVLEVVVPVSELARERGVSEDAVERELAAAKQTLFDVRERRVKPGRDDKLLSGWNGLMIRGLALASRVFGKPEWAKWAADAADFVLEKAWDGTRLARSYQEGQARIDGFLEDYGDLASGLTALYQATFDVKYLEAADALVRRAVDLFWDSEKAAYLTAPRGQKDLVVATYGLFDNAFPSGASTLTEAQVELAALTGDKQHLELPERYVARMHDGLVRNAMGYGYLGLAADALLEGAASVTVAGASDDVAPLRAAMDRAFAPTVALAWKAPGQPVPALLQGTFEGREPVKGRAAAYLCRGFVCELPVTEPDVLAQRLAALTGP